MGKLVALNTNNEEKKLKTEQPIATTVAQGRRGKLMQTALCGLVDALHSCSGNTGATPATLAKTAATEMAPSIANTIRNSVLAMGKDPQYWLSFSQVVGSGYEQALDDMKKSGENNNTARTKAALYAVGNGLMNQSAQEIEARVAE